MQNYAPPIIPMQAPKSSIKSCVFTETAMLLWFLQWENCKAGREKEGNYAGLIIQLQVESKILATLCELCLRCS